MSRPSTRTASLRSQLAISFGALSFGLAAFLSVALGTMIWQQTESGRGAALQADTVNVANALAEDLRKTSRSVAVLANSAAIWQDGLGAPAVTSMLSRIQTVNPDDSWIGVTDNDGIVRAATGDILVGHDVSGRPWFTPGTQGSHIGDVHQANLLAGYLPPSYSGEPRRFVDFASPIQLNGKRIGVLAIHGSWDWVDNVVHKLAPNRAEALQIESFIFDRAGRMVYAHAGSLMKFTEAGQSLPLEAGGAAKSLRWRDGQAYLTASYRMPQITDSIDMGWTVVTRQPVAIALEGAWAAAITTAVLGTLAAILSVVTAWTISGRLARPLTQIAAAARLVSSGQATSIPAQDGPSEVEALSNALNDMTAKLVAANAELEARVRERTAELVLANDALAKLARLDPLTGLPNRRTFDERAAQLVAAARRAGKPLSVIILDADHFKRVNDVHGHAVGDRTLIAIATAIRARLREQDVVARIGGEEFAALLPDTDGAGALQVARKVVESMRSLEIPLVGSITVSCGAAEIGMPAGDTADALARADSALYRAKYQGRDRAVLDAAESSAALPAGLPRPTAALALVPKAAA